MHRVRSIKGQDEAAGLELVVETVEVTRLSHVDWPAESRECPL